ncbi:hypothetical protein Goshw_014804 [Gossypium schwendimanii]|uniref:Aminotransferase-like plant mobile domain-containing protein n=1 Tax=Gossypium schwendimanii TaxID=34291 RepID=A0A7J9MMY7_GOSSC|nr:hypothetical protein [Gossypium schwendimanii]
MDLGEVQKEQHTRAYIFMIIGGFLMPDKSRNLVRLKWLLKLVDFREAVELSWGQPCWRRCTGRGVRWNHVSSYVRLPDELHDIRLLLDKRLEAEFEWTPYFDPAIQECILSKFLVNPNIWHVNMPLGRTDEHWLTFHAQYINIWGNKYEFLPTREAIIALELAYNSKYMPRFYFWTSIPGILHADAIDVLEDDGSDDDV